MSLSRFRGIIGEFQQEQDQESLFDIENYLVIQAAAEASNPDSGKQAKTGAPMRNDLPEIPVTSKDSTGDVIERFIYTLHQSGFELEAATVGTLYDRLVKTNFVSRTKAVLFKS